MDSEATGQCACGCITATAATSGLPADTVADLYRAYIDLQRDRSESLQPQPAPGTVQTDEAITRRAHDALPLLASVHAEVAAKWAAARARGLDMRERHGRNPITLTVSAVTDDDTFRRLAAAHPAAPVTHLLQNPTVPVLDALAHNKDLDEATLRTVAGLMPLDRVWAILSNVNCPLDLVDAALTRTGVFTHAPFAMHVRQAAIYHVTARLGYRDNDGHTPDARELNWDLDPGISDYAHPNTTGTFGNPAWANTVFHRGDENTLVGVRQACLYLLGGTPHSPLVQTLLDDPDPVTGPAGRVALAAASRNLNTLADLTRHPEPAVAATATARFLTLTGDPVYSLPR